MNWIDYVVAVVPFLVVVIVSWYARRYVKSVADFMSASRCAGRYLICNAAGEAAFGAVSAVAMFEYLYKTGFVLSWWQQLNAPVGMVLTLTGFVVYRYRETRVMTMAQFFEIRYSKKFRVFAGVLAFVSGILNYGIFPAVGARFFVNYCGLPQAISFRGLPVPTYAVLMVVFISTALFLTLVGGQLTIMICDCLEGMFSNVLCLVVAAALLWIIPWSHIYTALAAAPKGRSMLNPFDTAQAEDFNIWYVLIILVAQVYGYMSWQGNSGFRSAAASPHEAKMGQILGQWRGHARTVMMTLLGVCAFTYLNHPQYADGARNITAALKHIPEAPMQEQMRVPVTLSRILPVGAKGAFACIMLFAMLATDGSYMHSWGTIFIQDVILPFRQKPFSSKQHIRLLRCSIGGVGLFAFLFGLFFHQTEYILMFFAITGSVFLGGAGCAVLGGLYWKKGTTAAAWTSMIAGSSLATGGMVLQQCWKPLQSYFVNFFPNGRMHDYLLLHADKFPLNGAIVSLIAICAATLLYISISLLTYQTDFDMDQMLHRGRYATIVKAGNTREVPQKWTWGTLFGFSREFTAGDKLISGSVLVWSLFWFIAFVVGNVWYLMRPWSLETWGRYWFVYSLFLPFVIGTVTTVWLTWGGLADLRRLFLDLRTVKRSTLDDGTVIDHHNLDEVIDSAKRRAIPEEAVNRLAEKQIQHAAETR